MAFLFTEDHTVRLIANLCLMIILCVDVQQFKWGKRNEGSQEQFISFNFRNHQKLCECLSFHFSFHRFCLVWLKQKRAEHQKRWGFKKDFGLSYNFTFSLCLKTQFSGFAWPCHTPECPRLWISSVSGWLVTACHDLSTVYENRWIWKAL